MSSPDVERPEYVREEIGERDFGVVNKPLTAWERIWGNGAVRKCLILVILAAVWQAYAVYLNNELILPTFTDTLKAFVQRIASG